MKKPVGREGKPVIYRGVQYSSIVKASEATGEPYSRVFYEIKRSATNEKYAVVNAAIKGWGVVS